MLNCERSHYRRDPVDDMPINRSIAVQSQLLQASSTAYFMYTCRECDQEINEGTEICPHCGADLTVLSAEGRAAREIPLSKTLVRWVPLLVVLFGALGFFIWFMVKQQVP